MLLAAVLLLAVGCGGSEASSPPRGGAAGGAAKRPSTRRRWPRKNRDCHCLQLCAADRQRPVRAAVKKMQAGEDAELRYYNFYDRNDCQGIDGMRLTVKDGWRLFKRYR